MKLFFRRIHLYAGLAAGIIIMITCFTGAILVFEEELQHTFHPDRYFVEAGTKKLPLDQLAANVKQAVPEAKITRIQVFTDPERTAVINFEGGAKSQAFLNPYTGKLIELYAYKDTNFYTVFSLHRWLLKGDTGKMIVGTSSLIFLFILITGIILWFPKTKKILAKRLKVKWNAGWKRMNHDLHIVLGFYTAIFLFIFSFTGLAWSFEWFNNGIYKVTNSTKEFPKPPASKVQADVQTVSLNAILENAVDKVKDVKYYTLQMPKDSIAPFTVNVLPADAIHETATDSYYFDQFNGRLISVFRFDDRNLGQKVRSSFKPIHTGSIFGLPSKIIGFIACLLGTSFPVTGVILWINRMKKEKKRKLKKPLTPDLA